MKRRSFLAACLATIVVPFGVYALHAFKYRPAGEYAMVDSRWEVKGQRFHERYTVLWKCRRQLVADLSVYGPGAGHKTFTITPFRHA